MKAWNSGHGARAAGPGAQAGGCLLRKASWIVRLREIAGLPARLGDQAVRVQQTRQAGRRRLTL